jgi:hypothetical protein
MHFPQNMPGFFFLFIWSLCPIVHDSYISGPIAPVLFISLTVLSLLCFFPSAVKDSVSVHNPTFYSERFRSFMEKKVFKKIPSREYYYHDWCLKHSSGFRSIQYFNETQVKSSVVPYLRPWLFFFSSSDSQIRRISADVNCGLPCHVFFFPLTVILPSYSRGTFSAIIHTTK